MKVWIWLLLLAVWIPGALAQEAVAPIIIREYDDEFLKTYDGAELTLLDFCAPQDGYDYAGFPIVFSPDSSRFAYAGALPSGTGLSITRIYVCDLTAETLIPIAGQEGEKLRSLPAWSSDGSQLAYAQADSDGGANLEVVVYDLVTATGQVVFEREEASAAYLVPDIEWGAPGLAFYDVVRTAGEQMQTEVTFISLDANTIHTVLLDEPPAAVIGQWASQGEQTLFVLSAQGSDLTVINPTTNAVEERHGRLEVYSLSAPESLGLTQIETGDEWVVFGPDFNGGLGVTESEHSITIAPDGQKLALVAFENYPFGGKAYIIDNFEQFPYAATPIPGLDAAGLNQPGALYVFWGPTALRIYSD
jgi:hypothetical protein